MEDSVEKYYRSAYKFNPKNAIVWKEVCRYLEGIISKEDRVLDLGAGYCYFINNVNCGSKVAIDISEEIKNYADRSVETHVMSFEKLSSIFRPEFDIVFASNFFEHLTIEECRSCLIEISKISKPDSGRLIIIQPNYRYCCKDYFDDYTHRTIFDDKSICQLLNSEGFLPKIVKPKFMPYTTRGRNCFINKHLIRLYLYSPFKPYAGQMFIMAQSPKSGSL